MRKLDPAILREHQLEYEKKYREANRDKINFNMRKWRAAHPEKVSAASKRYAAKHPDVRAANKQRFKLAHPHYHSELYAKYPHQQHDRDRKYKYGITPEEHDQLYIKQDGRCAICGVDVCELKKPLCIDHDHITGKIRGLLCDDCNNMLGRAKDNIEVFQEAINYLGATPAG